MFASERTWLVSGASAFGAGEHRDLLAKTGIWRLANDSVHTLGCLSADETRQSADRLFEHFEILDSDFRDAWPKTIHTLPEGWQVNIHHCFRALAGRLAKADLRLDAIDDSVIPAKGS